MQTYNTAPFLAALKHVLVTDPSNITLPDGDLFFLANEACQPHEQLLYKDYLLHASNMGLPGEQNSNALFNQIERLIRAEIVKYKKHINKEAIENKPNWRSLTWVWTNRDKQQQLEQKQILAQYKATTKPEKEEQAITDEVVKAEAPKPAPAPIAAAAAALNPTAVRVDTKAPARKYDLNTPLNEKWKNRFRPDWPWNIKGANIIHLTLPQLQDIEAEIAAEKAEGFNHPNDRLDYRPQGGFRKNGFFTFIPNGETRLPACTFRDIAHLKESILKTIAEQEKQGWVLGRERPGK